MGAKTLSGKLIVLTVTTSILSIVLSWSIVSYDMSRQLDSILSDELSRDVNVFLNILATSANQNPTPKNELISWDKLVRWSELMGARITVIAGDGTVIADSSIPYENISGLDNHLDRIEVRKALQDGFGLDKRYSETTREPYMYYAIKTTIENLPGSDYIIRCSMPLPRYYTLLSRIRFDIFTALLISAFISLLVGSFYLGRITQPIKELVEALKASRRGDRPSYPIGASLEIDELSMSMRESAETQAKIMNDLLNERNHLETVVRSAPCGLMLVDSQGLVSCFNGMISPLLRYEPDPNDDNMADGLLRVPELINILVNARNGVRDSVEFTVRNRGIERFYTAVAIPVVGEEVLLVIDDITERHRMEEARKSFVADAGHEFQTPLTSISVAAELLLGMDESTPDEREPYITEIMRQRERMTMMVDDLLLLSRLESGLPASKSERFDLANLVEDKVAEAQKLPKASKLEWDINIPDSLMFEGQKNELERSVSNLLDNAVKYTHARYQEELGGMVCVTLMMQNNDLVLRIKDNGIGIPMNSMNQIFGRFERAGQDRSRTNDSTGGYGLGLAIAKSAIESHHGSINVECVDGFTTFTVSLPILKS